MLDTGAHRCNYTEAAIYSCQMCCCQRLAETCDCVGVNLQMAALVRCAIQQMAAPVGVCHGLVLPSVTA